MSSSTSSGCYVLHNDEIEQWSQSPCADPGNGVQACCQYGDVCVGSAICRSTSIVIGTSGYYTGGCTDETFSAPACLSQCGENPPKIIHLDRRCLLPTQVLLARQTLSLTPLLVFGLAAMGTMVVVIVPFRRSTKQSRHPPLEI